MTTQRVVYSLLTVDLSFLITNTYDGGMDLWEDFEEWFTCFYDPGQVGVEGSPCTIRSAVTGKNCTTGPGKCSVPVDGFESDACVAHAQYARGYQTNSGATFFKMNEVLVDEAITGVVISMSIAWVVLVVATGNMIVGSLAALTISAVVLCVMACIPILGYKLGTLESIIMVMVPGMSVDYIAHLAEAYCQAPVKSRHGRVVHMLGTTGVSVVSGAVTTLGASLFLLMCTIKFFFEFGSFLFATIALSMFWSLVFFPAVVSVIGTEGDTCHFDYRTTLHKMLLLAHVGKGGTQPVHPVGE